jgi:ribulose-5-phosphate 4-epimerase/fuculose-1-phosphate aldolase
VTDSNAVLAEKLNTAWRFFYGRGFVDGFGHISARTREPDKILITPHELTRESSPDEFVIVDLDGNQPDSDVKLPGELPIHLEVFKARPDVGAVAHFHCLNATSFSMSEHELRPTYFLASIFRDGIPVHPDARLVLHEERGAAMARTLGTHRAMLLRAHGIVVTGADVEEMTAGVFIMEDNARRTAIAAAMGKFETLSDAEMAEIEAEIFKTRGPVGRIWALCEAEAGKVG